jgi:hypothetical protein
MLYNVLRSHYSDIVIEARCIDISPLHDTVTFKVSLSRSRYWGPMHWYITFVWCLRTFGPLSRSRYWCPMHWYMAFIRCLWTSGPLLSRFRYWCPMHWYMAFARCLGTLLRPLYRDLVIEVQCIDIWPSHDAWERY